jgi:hypothetical protein
VLNKMLMIMKWRKRKEPEKGDIKEVKKFLWFPVCVGDDCRWLAKATVRYEFEGWDYANEDCYEFQLWRPVAFIN